MVTQPLRVTDNLGRFVASIKVEGGGVAGQAGAICHGIARALVAADEELRPALKKAGLLDSRPAREGAQEVRPQARSQGSAVHETVKGDFVPPHCSPLTVTSASAR